MSAIELSAKTSFRGRANESSRFGPTVPCVPAAASVWQPPHFATNSCFPLSVSPPRTTPPAPQPASRSTAPTSVSARSTLCGRLVGRGTQLRNGLLARGIDREHAVETRDLEDLRDVAVAADERELPVVRPEPFHAADEDAERRRVNKRRGAKDNDALLAALADHLEQLLLELRRRIQVDFAGEGDHIGVVSQLLRLDVEVHSSPEVVVTIGRPIPVAPESNRRPASKRAGAPRSAP